VSTGSRIVRLGAVSYLNTRPLVEGLAARPDVALRFDVPARCADLVEAGEVDLGLVPIIEYARHADDYAVVPDVSIASLAAVDSVALFTRQPIERVRSIALDTSSRTSVALTRVFCSRLFEIQPRFESRGPDLCDMLAHCDAALLIGDNALFQSPVASRQSPVSVEKIDLGDVWTRMTGQPFVYAFWAGPPDALAPADVAALQQARDEGVQRPDELARAYLAGAPERHQIGADYLRDNISYYLRDDERAGLEAFYRYAAEAGVVPEARPLRFF
jgi:chorismate dehydratase